VALAEYRLDDLARISGVTARNIRAYRERGLLDPPRRVGRSAYYDDYHLSQLKTISQLLRRGFNSAHIAEFFASMRQGADLADILGIQQAILGPRSDEPEEPAAPADTSTVRLEPGSDEARRLIDCGMAEIVDGEMVLKDAVLAAIVARSRDRMSYVSAILRVFESTRDSVDNLAADFVRVIEELYTARFGRSHVPKPEEMAEVSRIVLDYRDLGNRVLATHLDDAIRRQMVAAVSEFTADILFSGDRGSKP
jgi:DNA-binding transcriptional MerR regulator